MVEWHFQIRTRAPDPDPYAAGIDMGIDAHLSNHGMILNEAAHT